MTMKKAMRVRIPTGTPVAYTGLIGDVSEGFSGYIIGAAHEGFSGYTEVVKEGKFLSLAEAEARAKVLNDANGMTPLEAIKIVLWSMR